MDRQYNDQKKHGQAIQLQKETWTGIVCPCFLWSLYCLSMFLLVVVLSVHVSFGSCIAYNTTTKRNMDRPYKDQKKHGQTIQRPKETWTGNMSMFFLVVVLSVHVSFGRCIVCPSFFWSLYCLSMFLLVVVQKKHGQAIQRPKETWTDNTTTKRNMDRQYNDQKKHGQIIQPPNETWTGNRTTKGNMDRQIACPCFLHVSFGRCIVCPCFFWSLYCLSMFLLVVVMPVHVSFGRCKHGQAIQRPKEAWTDNTTTKRKMDRQYNDQKKHGLLVFYCLSMFLLVVVLPVHVSFGRCIACPCFCIYSITIKYTVYP
jgi:hypothetical protein